MSHKLVTVIIPTYNRVGMIGNAIQSVLNQTYPRVQIIVADDGSNDDTAEFVGRFENVEYYYQENKGQGACRNLGLLHARGEYIASLDSDDEWEPDFLETAVAALERFDADFVFLNWKQITGGDRVESDLVNSGRHLKYKSDSSGKWYLLGPQDCREYILSCCPAPSSALLMRRTSIPHRWNEEMTIGDDWYMLIDIATSQSCRAAFTHGIHWTKQIHDGNIYHGRDNIDIIRSLGLHDETIMLRDFTHRLTPREISNFKKRLAIHQLNFGRLTMRSNGGFFRAIQSIATALVFVPLGSLRYLTYMSLNSVEYRLGLSRERRKLRQKTP